MQITKPQIYIKETTIENIIALLSQVPEFEKPKPLEYYKSRLTNKRQLCVIAMNKEQKIMGFKVAYEKEDSLYSWLGAVFPEFRRQGIAKSLADYQENWALHEGFTEITFKTRNRFKAMLQFGLSNGFSIIEFRQRENNEESRILLKKTLI